MADPLPCRGLTTVEAARLLRVSPERVRDWIRRGELAAINTGRGRRVRFVILPEHLAAFTRRMAAVAETTPAPRRRRRTTGLIDYFPDA